MTEKEIWEDEEAREKQWREWTKAEREVMLCPKDDTIEDGLGSKWSAWCRECGLKTMSIVRPGKVQCNRCRLEE